MDTRKGLALICGILAVTSLWGATVQATDQNTNQAIWAVAGGVVLAAAAIWLWRSGR